MGIMDIYAFYLLPVQAMLGDVALNGFRSLIFNGSALGNARTQVCCGDVELWRWHSEQALLDFRQMFLDTFSLHLLVPWAMDCNEIRQLFQDACRLMPGDQLF